MASFSKEQIEDIFAYHPPRNEQERDDHQYIRETCGELAAGFNETLADCPEKTLAIRALQQASMWANAALALNRPTDENPSPE